MIIVTVSYASYKFLNFCCLSSRSKDVAELYANMTFDPNKINLQQPSEDCVLGERATVCVKTRVCFSYSVKSEKDGTNLGTGESLIDPFPFIQYVYMFTV